MTTLNDLKTHGKLPKELKERFPIEAKIIEWMTSFNPNDRPST
jgi:hypothetical protein